MQINGVNLEFLGHSGFLISIPAIGKRVAIDPYVVGDLDKVDVILITHSHYDHCSIKDMEKLAGKNTLIVIPADVQSKITRLNGVDMRVVETGDEFDLGFMRIEVVPAYNIGKKFHPKQEGWFGYVLKIKEVVIYHAGDSDRIPEMEKLTGYGKLENKFIILLPVSGKYVMTAEEAADAAIMLKPYLAVPMHYGSGVAGTLEDAQRFVQICKERGIGAKILEKI